MTNRARFLIVFPHYSLLFLFLSSFSSVSCLEGAHGYKTFIHDWVTLILIRLEKHQTLGAENLN